MTVLEAQGTAVTLGLPFVSPLSESHLIYRPLLSCWTPFFWWSAASGGSRQKAA